MLALRGALSCPHAVNRARGESWADPRDPVMHALQRVDRTRNNRELAKEKRKQVEMKWKEIDDES